MTMIGAMWLVLSSGTEMAGSSKKFFGCGKSEETVTHDAARDVPQARGGVARDAFEHVRVVRHEPPRMIGIGRTTLHESCYGSPLSGS